MDSRGLVRSVFVVAGLAVLLAGAPFCLADEDPGWLDLWVRDSDSGHGVPAHLRLTFEGGQRTVALPSSGRKRISLAEGRTSIEAVAAGYAALRTESFVRRGRTLAVTLWLDPTTIPETCLVPRVLARDRALLHGHVVDASRGRPVPGASVRVEATGAATRTDAGGRFELTLALPARGPDDLPPSGDLIVESAGYRTYRQRDLPLVEGDTHLIVTIRPGRSTDTDEDDGRHQLIRVREASESMQQIVSGVEPSDGSDDVASPRSRAHVAGDDETRVISTVWAPPASIRVGYNCDCTVCSTVQVFLLETYVKRGLNDEWIASWSDHSLRAGAVPYRSYGVWHVFHPIDPNYDICSSTCCQVNDPDTSHRTNSAVDRAPGIMLEASGEILRSEYAAENNAWDDPDDGRSCSNADQSCGDGLAGSPALGWPCLADSPCLGHGCYGHGRGMCQWGTQRWASGEGRLWNWIVDHYYNDDDNPSGLRSGYMTSPLEIVDAAPDRPGVEAGETFQIDLDVENLAALEHPWIAIGAELWSDATGFIDDPANDQPVALPPGGTMVSRLFAVPSDAPDGPYDLLTTLWIDVDEDGSIGGLDQPLVTHTVVAAVEVCSDPVPVGNSLRLAFIAPDAVELTWSTVANASSYIVYRSSSPASGWEAVGSTEDTTFVDPGAMAPLAFYEVSSSNLCGESGF